MNGWDTGLLGWEFGLLGWDTGLLGWDTFLYFFVEKKAENREFHTYASSHVKKKHAYEGFAYFLHPVVQKKFRKSHHSSHSSCAKFGLLFLDSGLLGWDTSNG